MLAFRQGYDIYKRFSPLAPAIFHGLFICLDAPFSTALLHGLFICLDAVEIGYDIYIWCFSWILQNIQQSIFIRIGSTYM